MELGGQRHAPAALPLRLRDPLLILHEGGWIPWAQSGQVWKISPPPLSDPRDPTSRSDSLYRLSHHCPYN
jgi:hypothetical protein